MGITPYDNQSAINIIYRYRSFNGYSSFGQRNHLFPSMAISTNNQSSTNSFAQFDPASQTATYKDGVGTVPPPDILHGTSNNGDNNVRVFPTSDYEIFNVYELRAKYFLHQRIEINGIMPVNNIRSLESGETIDHTGLGDITVFAGYHLIRRIEEEKLQQRLIIGGGLKLPVGNYYAQENEERIPLLLQPGTGSIDYLGYFNYLIGYKKWGISINSMFKFNGENYYKEKICNSTTDYLSVFYKMKSDNWTFIPSLQMYYENTKGVKIDGELQEGTAMNLGMAGAGLDVYYKNISLNTALQYKVFEQTGQGNLGSAGRIVVGLGYNFRQLNYLIKEKDNEPKDTL